MTCFRSLLLLLLIITFCESKYNDLRKTLSLEALLDNRNKSMVVSTLLLRFPLCKLATHAQGYTRNELLSILGIKYNAAKCYTSFSDAMEGLKNLDLMMLNKILMNYTLGVRSSFISNSTNFGVKVDQIGFNYPKVAVALVNQWIHKASIKRITDILDENDIHNKTSILVVSGAYFKVTWEYPFDLRLTKYVKFHHHNGTLSMVPMMKTTTTCLYLDDPITGALFVNLKLAAFGLSLTIAVPSTPRDLIRLIGQVSSLPDTLQGVYKRMHYQNVNVMLPRFKVKTTIEWNKHLQKIGLLRIFNETNAELNGILTEKNKIKMFLSKVKQKIFIDVDEMGIFRQKINYDHDVIFHAPHLKNNHGPLIMADHPFLFSVNLQSDPNDRLDMHELFTGVYYGPEY